MQPAALIWNERICGSLVPGWPPSAVIPRMSFQKVEIGCNGLDLGFAQVMRNWPHDGRRVRLGFVLAALLVPICQLPEHVVMELSCEPRKCIGAFGVWPVTRSTWRNLGLGHSLFVELLALSHVLPSRPSERLGVEILEVFGETFQH